MTNPAPRATAAPTDFIREKVRADRDSNKYGGRVATRFPPEPNGYLHIGHAKAICLNFGVASEFGGVCHLRMDDTNPATEDVEYVAAIQRDVRWLGFDWGEHLYYASEYYGRLYALAEGLIEKGRAYVCHLNEEQMSEHRGSVSEPGRDSPYRDRSVEENLELFRKMRAGGFREGECVLRAKIDMASPNMKLRDPPIYRIKHAHHYRTGDAWCIYPLYDYAHCLSDAEERITHSLCTLEFESARDLYDWVIEATEVPWVPKQTEFARLNLTYTVMSKRKLLELVEGKHVAGWDDPRLPTIAGLRRRGVRASAIREFCAKIGVAKNISTVDVALFEHTVREDLNAASPRVMAVLRPLRLTLEGYPEALTEAFDAPYFPQELEPKGAVAENVKRSRSVPFSRTLFVERDDFAEHPPADFTRLAPGRTVRLRHAYVVRCERVVKDERGEVVEVVCSYDPETRGGVAKKGTKVGGTIHWVSAEHGVRAEARLYDRLFSVEEPGTTEGRSFLEELNPRSVEVVSAVVEPSLRDAKPGDHVQFERLGYFCVDDSSTVSALVFNRTAALRDSWAKAAAKPVPAKDTTREPAKEQPRAAAKAPKREEIALAGEALARRDAHGLSNEDATTLASEAALARLFDEAAARGAPAKPLAALLKNDVLGELRARDLLGAASLPFDGARLAELVSLVAEGTLSAKLGKDVLAAMFAGEGAPRDIVKARGLQQIVDEGAIEASVDRVLAENADAVGRYRAGNTNVFGALVGLCMKATGGKANPKLVSEVLRKKL